ncbi:MAG: PDZ domain-containing protein [Pirellulales bacterium]
MKTFAIALAGMLALGILVQRASAQPILNRVERFLRDQVDAATESPQPAEPGYLGLIGNDDADGGRGVRVLEVSPGHAAAQAGLRKGDLITTIGGRPIRAMDDMAGALEGKAAGAKLSMTVTREGAQQEYTVTLGRRPDAPPAPEPRPRLGVRSVPVSEAVRRQNSLDAARGAHVISVVVGSPAERAGIPLGAIITAIDATPINTPDELAAAIGGAKTSQVELTYLDRGRSVRKKVSLAMPLAAREPPQREVRARPPLAEAPGPADAKSPAAAEPVVENPALDEDDRVTTLERRLEQLEARIKTLEAELAKQKTPDAAAEQK